MPMPLAKPAKPVKPFKSPPAKRKIPRSGQPRNANAPIIIPTDNTTGAPITVSAIQDTAGGNLYCIAMAD